MPMPWANIIDPPNSNKVLYMCIYICIYIHNDITQYSKHIIAEQTNTSQVYNVVCETHFGKLVQ